MRFFISFFSFFKKTTDLNALQKIKNGILIDVSTYHCMLEDSLHNRRKHFNYN